MISDDDHDIVIFAWLEIHVPLVPIEDTAEQSLGRVVQGSDVSKVLN